MLSCLDASLKFLSFATVTKYLSCLSSIVENIYVSWILCAKVITIIDSGNSLLCELSIADGVKVHYGAVLQISWTSFVSTQRFLWAILFLLKLQQLVLQRRARNGLWMTYRHSLISKRTTCRSRLQYVTPTGITGTVLLSAKTNSSANISFLGEFTTTLGIWCLRMFFVMFRIFILALVYNTIINVPASR